MNVIENWEALNQSSMEEVRFAKLNVTEELNGIDIFPLYFLFI